MARFIMAQVLYPNAENRTNVLPKKNGLRSSRSSGNVLAKKWYTYCTSTVARVLDEPSAFIEKPVFC